MCVLGTIKKKNDGTIPIFTVLCGYLDGSAYDKVIQRLICQP